MTPRLTAHSQLWLPLAALLAALVLGVALAARPGRAGGAAAWRDFELARRPRSGAGGTAGLPGAAGPARRVIALSLAAEEVILELAGPERLAAVTKLARDPYYSNAVEQAALVPETAAGQAIERLIRLGPDLVVVATYTDPRARRMLERCGIAVLALPELRSFESIRRAILALGERLGLDAEAARLAADFSARLERTRARAARSVELRGGTPPAVLHIGSDLRAPWTAGRETIIDEVLRAAGAVNVAAREGAVHEVGLNKEAVVRWRPDILLLEGEPREREERLRGLRADPLLAGLEAAAAGRVILVPARLLTAASHHVAGAAEMLQAELYPGAESALPPAERLDNQSAEERRGGR